MVRYIHGSEDSLDLDVYYVFEKMPDFHECRTFCSGDSSENRNIITIVNGLVDDAFIGVIDEVNNGLIDTYPLHIQDYPLIITDRMPRNVIIKQIRSIRGILSLLSRTPYRQQIKYALRGNWSHRIECLKDIDLCCLDFNRMNKQMDSYSVLKVIAFQIGQALGLLNGKEFYTKSSVSKEYPTLEPFLYRSKAAFIKDIDHMLQVYTAAVEHIKYEEIDSNTVYFPDYDKTYELRHENEIQ